MAKRAQTGFRLAHTFLDLMDGLAGFLGVTRTRLLEDSVKAVATTYNVGARAHNASVEELIRRYGEDAPITIKLSDDGEAQVLLDGLPPDDVVCQLAIEESAGVAHVFLDVVGWFSDELGTVRLGDHVLVVRPLLATARLPWPPDPTLGLVARLGDLASRAQAGDLVTLPAVEEAVV